jgi:RHS repeat-associated protein
VAKSDYQYDPAGRLTNLKHSHDGNTIADYGWEYDKGSRITKHTSPDGSSEYNYDKTNQLTGSDHSTQTDESYQYDSNGNRTGSGYTNGANNQLLSDGTYNYEYDGEGNRTKRTEIATGKVDEYTWDYRNRLTNVVTKDSNGNATGRDEYTYDAFDKRISKSVDADGDGSGSAEIEKYVYDGDNIALVFDGSGNQKERFLHGTGVDSVIAQENADGQVKWALSDNQGTVRDVIDSNGNVLNHLVYDSFGKVIGETNPAVNFRFGYTGQELDPETGNYNYGRRFYDPNVGRFISEDPTGFNAGDANLYRYVRNNPINFVDPFGLCGSSNFDFLGGDDSSGIQKIHGNYAKLLAEYDLDGNLIASNEGGFGDDSFTLAQISQGDSEFSPWQIFGDPLTGITLTIELFKAFIDFVDGDNPSVSDTTNLFDNSLTIQNSDTPNYYSDLIQKIDPSLFDPNNLNKNKDLFSFDSNTQFPKPLSDADKQNIFKSPNADPLSGQPDIKTFPNAALDDLIKNYFDSSISSLNAGDWDSRTNQNGSITIGDETLPKRINITDPTHGILVNPDTGNKILLRSGTTDLGQQTANTLEKLGKFNENVEASLKHAEGNAAAFLRTRPEITTATLTINHTYICKFCRKGLENILNPGQTLEVKYMNSYGNIRKETFTGK